MSYASFTKIVPDLLKNIPQKLLQPTGIAVIASVGIHAVVAGVLLPRWSMSSEKKSQPVRNVPLLQLTPAEQSRLPQMPPSSLPSMANQLPPLSSLPYSGSSSLPALPSKDSSLFNLPPISPLPPFGKIPSLSQSPRQQQNNLNQLAIRNSPSRNELSTSKRLTSPNSQLPKTASSQPITPSSSELPPPPLSSWTVTSKELGLPGGLNPASPPAVPLNSDGTVPQQSMLPPSTMPERPLPPSTPRVLPIDSYPIPPSVGTPMPTSQAADIAAIPNQRNSTDIYPINPNTGTPTPTSQAAVVAPIQNQRNSTDIYPINPMTGTPTQTPQAAVVAPIQNQTNSTNNSGSSSDRNNIAFLNNLENWSKRNQTSNQISDPKRLDISGNYPAKARTTGGPNSGIVAVAVKVDENGKIISDSLQVVGSDVSNDVFDEEAQAAVRRHQFQGTGKVELYSVKVQFNNSSSALRSTTGLPAPAAPPNLAKPQNVPNRPTSTNVPPSNTTSTPAQSFMEKLRKDLTNTPRSSTTDKLPSNTTNTPRSSTTDKPPSNTTNTSRSSTTDKPPSNTMDKPPSNTTNTSRSTTTEKPPSNTTNTSRSTTTDKPPSNTTATSGQNLIDNLRRTLTDTPRSKTTDTTAPNPTKE